MNRTRTSPVGAPGDRTQRNCIDPVLSGNSARIGEFVRGAINKTDHLDIVVIGDSNSGYSDGTGARGYSGGFFDSITQTLNSYIYTTGQFYTGATSSVFPVNGSPNGTVLPLCFQCSNVTKITYVAPGASGGFWYTGSINGYPNQGSGDPGADIVASYLKPFFRNDGTYKLELGTQGADPHAQCAYFHNTTGGTNSYAGTWIKLYYNNTTTYPWAANVLHCQNAVTYRTYHLKIPGAGATAKYTSWVYIDAGSGTGSAQTSVAMTNAGAVPVLGYDDRDVNPGTSATRIAGTFNSNNTALGTIGPMAVLYHTFFRKNTPGFGISVMQYSGGATTAQVASAFGDSTFGVGLSTQAYYLKCIRDTQISAGGKGRVMIFINMGTNSSANGFQYMKDGATIINQLKTAWGQTGAPTDDLVFVISATAQWTSFDPALANAGVEALGTTEANVAAFSLGPDLGVTQSYLTTNSYYASPTTSGSSSPSAHLAQTGYSAVATLILNKLKLL